MALKKTIEDKGGEAIVIVADFSKEAEAADAVRQAEAAFGKLDILINNAGVMYLEPLAEADLARWRHMFELNVLGLIAASQAALPGMQARREGHIVNISSTAGRVANPNGVGYSGTKFAVVAVSESLRKEVFKDNIRVTVIEPGVAETELRDHVAHEGAQKAVNAWASSMRQLQAKDIANAVFFAVSQPDYVCINEIMRCGPPIRIADCTHCTALIDLAARQQKGRREPAFLISDQVARGARRALSGPGSRGSRPGGRRA